MKSGTTTGMGTAEKKPDMSNPSSEGNVGPGTNNNSGKQPGGELAEFTKCSPDRRRAFSQCMSEPDGIG